MSGDYLDKFQSMTINDNESYDGGMSEERVYSIERIAPDKFTNSMKSSKTISGKSSFREMVSSQLKKPESADITIQIGDEMFKVPILVLQSYSKFFQAYSCHDKVIKLPPSSISANVFHTIYAWMLNTSKLVGREDLVSLLMGAQVNVIKIRLIEKTSLSTFV